MPDQEKAQAVKDTEAAKEAADRKAVEEAQKQAPAPDRRETKG